MSEIILNDKKTIRGWAFFDWANSAHALIIAVAIFPNYFEAITDDVIGILGMQLQSTSFYAYCVTISYLVILFITPLLSGIADYGGKRKTFMRFFTALGGLSCIVLFLFKGMDSIWIGSLAFICSTIGFAGSIVFYNSYLPQIATPDHYDRVSAQGFSYGYVGSVLLLIFCLAMIQKPAWFGLEDGTLPVRISFVLVGLWWLGFAQITFKRMPNDKKSPLPSGIIGKGFDELRQVWHQLSGKVNTKSFLVAYFFYSIGVQTIILMAATFATDELNMGTVDLIIITLILQIVAIGGAYLFALLSERKGNKISLILMLVIWIGICFIGYFVKGKLEFYALAGAVGLVMGGIQSLSRSTYSKLIEKKVDDLASYFSFYDVLQKSAIVLGTFVFGFVAQLTGGMRNSILALGVFFVIGILILWFKVHIPKTEN